jgi:SAM-dependent methyltransferase
MSSVQHRTVLPYTQFAKAYDVTLGIPSLVRTRKIFETLVRQYGIRFQNAADLGCGTGLFACYLSRCWNVPVFAVDRSPDMLEVARRNCRGSNVCLLCQDIRCLRLPCPVDLATANFDTLNHLVDDADLRLALRRIFDNLRPGGHLLFDLLTPCEPLGGRRLYTRCLRSVRHNITQQIAWDETRRIISILVVLRSPRSRHSTVERHRERAYAPAEVGKWLLDSGFLIRGVHDAATLGPAHDCPPRIMVIARKRESEDVRSNR